MQKEEEDKKIKLSEKEEAKDRFGKQQKANRHQMGDSRPPEKDQSGEEGGVPQKKKISKIGENLNQRRSMRLNRPIRWRQKK